MLISLPTSVRLLSPLWSTPLALAAAAAAAALSNILVDSMVRLLCGPLDWQSRRSMSLIPLRRSRWIAVLDSATLPVDDD
jgi:hypothetical protein